jgi:photosystem II stability/assembly factor-like uncharacterized protein
MALSSAYFIDANTGYVVGDMGAILKTTNGGATWTIQPSGSGNSVSSVFFIDAATGYAVGDFGTYWKHTVVP